MKYDCDRCGVKYNEYPDRWKEIIQMLLDNQQYFYCHKCGNKIKK